LADGELQPDEARDIAWRRARHEIEHATGTRDESGLIQIGDCARFFGPALTRRAAQNDELAAQAALLLMGAGIAPPLHFVSHLTSDQDLWRAAAARSLTTASPVGEQAVPAALPLPKSPASRRESSAGARRLARAAQWRRRLMLDPAEVVRRAALLAAADAADPADGRAVLEAARLDPDGEIRAIAIEAAAQIGTLQIVLALEDLWEIADEDDRLAIVAAWAAVMRRAERSSCVAQSRAPACVARRRLARVVETNEGSLVGVRAALELIHDGVAADDAAGQAAGMLERAIDDAPTDARVEAIAGAPLSEAFLLEAIVEASAAQDEQVVVASLARLIELGDEKREESLEALRGHAKGSDEVADQAKLALVRAGDKKVLALLSGDAGAKSAETRADAASAYARLGAYAEVLKLLADKDATVRATAVCAILRASDGS